MRKRDLDHNLDFRHAAIVAQRKRPHPSVLQIAPLGQANRVARLLATAASLAPSTGRPASLPHHARALELWADEPGVPLKPRCRSCGWMKNENGAP
jgi:hypothetical protein